MLIKRFKSIIYIKLWYYWEPNYSPFVLVINELLLLFWHFTNPSLHPFWYSIGNLCSNILWQITENCNNCLLHWSLHVLNSSFLTHSNYLVKLVYLTRGYGFTYIIHIIIHIIIHMIHMIHIIIYYPYYYPWNYPWNYPCDFYPYSWNYIE